MAPWGREIQISNRQYLGNEHEGSVKEILKTTGAEWQRAAAAIGRGPMAAMVQLPLTAGDDDGRVR